MSRVHLQILLALLLTLSLGSTPVIAQDDTSAPSVQFNLLSADGLVFGSTIEVDAEFAAENEVEVLAPFSFLVPTADDIRELLDPAPEPGQALIKVNFATLDGELIENLQFVPFTLGLGDLEDRMNTLAGLMANDAFQMAVGTHEENTRDLVRSVKIGEYNGVEVIGRYQDAELGLMYLRIVGILNPDSENSVMAIANVVAAKQEIPAPDDFPRTRGGTALNNFKFLASQ